MVRLYGSTDRGDAPGGVAFDDSITVYAVGVPLRSPDVGVCANQFDRPNDGVVEVSAQAPAARFIPAHGLGQFC